MKLTHAQKSATVNALCAARDALVEPLTGEALLATQPIRLSILELVEELLEVDAIVDACLRETPGLARIHAAHHDLHPDDPEASEAAARARWLRGFHPVVRGTLEDALAARRQAGQAEEVSS